MKAKRRARFSASSTVSSTFPNDYSNIPSPLESPTPVTVHFHDHHSSSAARIQAAYRSYVVRRLVRKIAAVQSGVDRMERLIQRQETVDALRSSEKEKLRINEELMRLLLELDSVPGFDPGVRELRRRVSRRIVGLQEVVDGICQCGERIIGLDGWDGIWKEWDWNWDEAIGHMEEQVCRERGGEELERFCALHFGFRCFQRFLRDA